MRLAVRSSLLACVAVFGLVFVGFQASAESQPDADLGVSATETVIASSVDTPLESEADSDEPAPDPPSSSTSPFVRGPGSSLSFGEFDEAVGMVTPAGTVTEYDTSFSPTSLAVGGDGAIWYASLTGSGIGRVTSDGDVADWAVPGRPDGLVLGPDGNIWFGNLANSVAVPPGWACTTPTVGTSGAIGCATRRLAYGANAILWIDTRLIDSVRPGTSLTNTATVSSDAPDPDSTNNSASVTVWTSVPTVSRARSERAAPAALPFTGAPGDAILILALALLVAGFVVGSTARIALRLR